MKPNYFDVFDLPRRLQLDAKDLERRFHALSRTLHPDVSRDPNALDASATLNDAYRTLRDPVARAEYLLKENGFDIGEQKSKDVPAELLEEVFEMNMALEELRGGDEAARPQLEAARARFLEMRGEVDRDLLGKFAEYDASMNRDILAEIRAVLNRRRYVRNLVNEVEKSLSPS